MVVRVIDQCRCTFDDNVCMCTHERNLSRTNSFLLVFVTHLAVCITIQYTCLNVRGRVCETFTHYDEFALPKSTFLIPFFRPSSPFHDQRYICNLKLEGLVRNVLTIFNEQSNKEMVTTRVCYLHHKFLSVTSCHSIVRFARLSGRQTQKVVEHLECRCRFIPGYHMTSSTYRDEL